MSMERNYKIFTIPNILTFLRILMIPFFIYSYMNGDHLMSAGWMFASGLTDFLDGFIARHYHQVSELGKTLDPIADKLTQLAIIFVLVFTVSYMWILFALFLIKEASMLICWLRLQAKGKYFNGALWFGKISTAVFYISMFLMIAFPIEKTIFATILMLITGFFLSLSFLMYMKTYLSMLRDL